jgi:hypothetical protein
VRWGTEVGNQDRGQVDVTKDQNHCPMFSRTDQQPLRHRLAVNYDRGEPRCRLLKHLLFQYLLFLSQRNSKQQSEIFWNRYFNTNSAPDDVDVPNSDVLLILVSPIYSSHSKCNLPPSSRFHQLPEKL